MEKIAALFVEKGGVYSGLPLVSVWDEARDARLYRGPDPVIAHPPCKRWGRYWSGGPSARVRREMGDDEGCFAHALWSVRTFGGVLEHPEASHAWRWHGLARPPKSGGWIVADDFGGVTCCVEQGHYGHRARKATWLYLVAGAQTELIWGVCAGRERLDHGFHSKAERAAYRGPKIKRLTPRENAATPIAFRDVLIALAQPATKLDIDEMLYDADRALGYHEDF